jgi:hypothetical protein
MLSKKRARKKTAKTAGFSQFSLYTVVPIPYHSNERERANTDPQAMYNGKNSNFKGELWQN